MRQLASVPSGCQQWTRGSITSSTDKFAFAATLAVYIYSIEECRLVTIWAGHEHHITCIGFSPYDGNLLACTTTDQNVKLFDCESECEHRQVKLPKQHASHVLWHRGERHTLLLAAASSLWRWQHQDNTCEAVRDFKSQIVCMSSSPVDPNLVVVGLQEGSAQVYDFKLRQVLQVLRPPEGPTPPGGIVDAKWDPLSRQYLLLSFQSGLMGLYEIEGGTQMSSFPKQGVGCRTLEFVPDAPGNFVTVNNKSGAMQLWNVSQTTPLKSFKTGLGPAHAVTLIPGTHTALVSAQDGTVLMYDMDMQRVKWRTEGGHTETIFDCQFSAHDPNLLATCSFDSSVRVWDVTTLKCIKHLTGAQGILYSVTWSPDGRHIAASSKSGTVYVFDYGKGMLVKAFKQHEQASMRCAFSPSNSQVLASTGLEGTVQVYKLDGTAVRTMRHTSAVNGLAWSGFEPGVVATATEDGKVFVWDVGKQPQESLRQTLAGHTGKAFNVAWSPLIPRLLASTGNDRTARVWDAHRGESLATLQGHSQEVRGVTWHPEVPFMLFTGSWDSDIRVWDYRREQCLKVLADHHSDVYGLSIHPQRPMLLASASRDTTLRLWSTAELTPGVLATALLRPEGPERGDAEEALRQLNPVATPSIDALASAIGASKIMDVCGIGSSTGGIGGGASGTGGGTVMSGAGSAALAERLLPFCQQRQAVYTCVQPLGVPGTELLERYARVFDFFCNPGSLRPLWDLAALVAAGQQHPAAQQAAAGGRASTSGGANAAEPALCHWSSVKASVTSQASHLELAASSKARSSLGGARKEDCLRDAALLHLQGGNVQRCCELLIQIDEWDRALALAPAVSMDYWQRLMQARAQQVASQQGASIHDVGPLLLAAGRSDQLVQLLTGSQQFNAAFCIATGAAAGAYPAPLQQQQQQQALPLGPLRISVSGRRSGSGRPPADPGAGIEELAVSPTAAADRRMLTPVSGRKALAALVSKGASRQEGDRAEQQLQQQQATTTALSPGMQIRMLRAPSGLPSPTARTASQELPPLDYVPLAAELLGPDEGVGRERVYGGASVHLPPLMSPPGSFTSGHASGGAASFGASGGAGSFGFGASGGTGSFGVGASGGTGFGASGATSGERLNGIRSDPASNMSRLVGPAFGGGTPPGSPHSAFRRAPSVSVSAQLPQPLQPPQPPAVASGSSFTRANVSLSSGGTRDAEQQQLGPRPRVSMDARGARDLEPAAAPLQPLPPPQQQQQAAAALTPSMAAVRQQQAKALLARGDPVQAACCLLTTDDVAAAVTALVRGHCEEEALALATALGQPQCMQSELMVLVAAKCEAQGAPLVALELLKRAAGTRSGGSSGAAGEALQLLAARLCAAAGTEEEERRVMGSAGLIAHADHHLAAAQEETDDVQAARLLLLAGRHQAAAQRLLAAAADLLAQLHRQHDNEPHQDDYDYPSGDQDRSRRRGESEESEASPGVNVHGRVTGEHRLLWAALNSLNPQVLASYTWHEVFCCCCYLGGCAALQQGYGAVGAFLLASAQRCLEHRLATAATSSHSRAASTRYSRHHQRQWSADSGSGGGASVSIASVLSSQQCSDVLVQWTGCCDDADALLDCLQVQTLPPEVAQAARLRLVALAGGSTAAATAAGGDPRAHAAGSGINLLRGHSLTAQGAAGMTSRSFESSGSLNRRLGSHSRANSMRDLMAPCFGSVAASVADADPLLPPVLLGAVVVQGALLPCRHVHGVPSRSLVTGRLIRGAAVTLEDGSSCVSLSEAVMLRRVMRYSPLGTGQLMPLM